MPAPRSCRSFPSAPLPGGHAPMDPHETPLTPMLRAAAPCNMRRVRLHDVARAGAISINPHRSGPRSRGCHERRAGASA